MEGYCKHCARTVIIDSLCPPVRFPVLRCPACADDRWRGNRSRERTAETRVAGLPARNSPALRLQQPPQASHRTEAIEVAHRNNQLVGPPAAEHRHQKV